MHREHSEPGGGEENGEGVVWGELRIIMRTLMRTERVRRWCIC